MAQAGGISPLEMDPLSRYSGGGARSIRGVLASSFARGLPEDLDFAMAHCAEQQDAINALGASRALDKWCLRAVGGLGDAVAADAVPRSNLRTLGASRACDLAAGDCSAARAFDVTRGRMLVAALADDVPSSARRAASRLGGRTRWADTSLAATMGRMMVRPKRPTVAVALHSPPRRAREERT
eukprot:CAMPEP_0196198612 /NCGR_PEP_ID=MMETSP0912-20130531/2588_1 /TAXON_ID=49265 /ORGANISM="Thalassiosira rotula, Strain GSO102" /LENGTH=182 /DNA_ID=CAMNT_0041471643 /DNA_START=349 /DNA_END=898 /DNA_ORIENTATION=-